MSRKVFLGAIGIFGAALAYVANEFGLALNAAAITAALMSIGVYIYGEFKLDIKRFGSQFHRFTDPKFIIALIAVILGALNQNFGTGIPVEAVIAVLTLIMGVLFRRDFKVIS